MSREEAALAALEALYDAAEDDSATGGPDLARRLFPVLSVIDEDGYRRLPEAEVRRPSLEVVERRRSRPDGPNAPV